MKLEKMRDTLIANDVDLSSSQFTNTRLAGARFDDVNLQGAEFHNINLKGATFTEVDLTGAAIHHSNVAGMTIDSMPVTDLLARSPAGVPRVAGLAAFVPAKDFDLAKAFYTDLGFVVAWTNAEIAELQLGAFRFLLQKFYVAEHAGNFMMSLAVDDADAWWAHIEAKQLAAKYPGITCKAPAVQPWGLRVLYLSDPTGVLWHINDRRC